MLKLLGVEESHYIISYIFSLVDKFLIMKEWDSFLGFAPAREGNFSKRSFFVQI